MNTVAHAQLTLQMSTLLQKYLYSQNQYSTTWDSKCQVQVAHMVRAFGMNSKVGGLNPSQVETVFVSKTSTISQEYPVHESKINAVTQAQLTFQMSTLLQKYNWIAFVTN